ncbi:MAG: TIGR00725 family protein [Elusimicrobiota bacterium]
MKKQLNLKDLKSAKSSKKVVGVIGGSRADSTVKKIAREVGRRIAKKGYILVCGGLGGVMQATCKGASEAGGFTVGILPGRSKKSANPFVDLPVVTGMSHARNAIIVRTADILIAIDGRYGTLSEIALAKASGKRVIGLMTWDEVSGVESVESVKEAMMRIEGH